MDYNDYETWSENARLARAEYLLGKLTAEAFLQKIDTTHELKIYEAGREQLDFRCSLPLSFTYYRIADPVS